MVGLLVLFLLLYIPILVLSWRSKPIDKDKSVSYTHLILSAKTLYDLASAIVQLFEFDFDHAFGFYSKLTGRIFDSPVKYELFADMGESNARSVKRAPVSYTHLFAPFPLRSTVAT